VDYSKIQIMQMMKHKMAYHSERQDVLSQNIANADTPGYRPRDIPEPDFTEELKKRTRLQMRKTSPMHSEGTFFKVPEFRAEQDDYFEIKPVKNAVNVEEQMAKVSHNAFEFQTTTSLYRKTAGLFKTAIGTGQ